MTTPQRQIEDFLRGQIDCAKGVPHQAGKSEHYDRGYSAEYHFQQQRDERTAQNERNR